MIIETIEDRFMGENTYLLGDEKNNKCVIIDPGASLIDILSAVKNRNFTVEYIILTHGHADHIANVKKLKAETNAKILELGELRLTFIHTPGHTPGGMCIKVGDHMFTGDTLFAGSIGRTDFYGGDFKQMNKSLNKLSNQNGNIKIYPGHGPTSTIEIEKLTNPYMN